MKIRFKIPFFRAKISTAEMRKQERYSCAYPSRITIDETGAEFEGEINQISTGGYRFRPASLYILRRENDLVNIEILGRSMGGIIRRTTTKGYGVQFDEALSEDVMAEILAYGTPEVRDQAA